MKYNIFKQSVLHYASSCIKNNCFMKFRSKVIGKFIIKIKIFLWLINISVNQLTASYLVPVSCSWKIVQVHSSNVRTYVRACVHTHINCTHIHIHIICTQKLIFIHKYIHLDTYTYHAHMKAYAHTCTCTYTHTHARTHTHTHTQWQANMCSPISPDYSSLD